MSPKLKGCLRSKTEKQQALVNHLVDLDRKINGTKFQMDQLQVGREAFFTMLKNSLVAAKAIAEANAQQAQAGEEAPTVQ